MEFVGTKSEHFVTHLNREELKVKEQAERSANKAEEWIRR